MNNQTKLSILCQLRGEHSGYYFCITNYPKKKRCMIAITYFHRFCASGIWIEHNGDSLFLLYDAQGLEGQRLESPEVLFTHMSMCLGFLTVWWLQVVTLFTWWLGVSSMSIPGNKTKTISHVLTHHWKSHSDFLVLPSAFLDC